MGARGTRRSANQRLPRLWIEGATVFEPADPCGCARRACRHTLSSMSSHSGSSRLFPALERRSSTLLRPSTPVSRRGDDAHTVPSRSRRSGTLGGAGRPNGMGARYGWKWPAYGVSCAASPRCDIARSRWTYVGVVLAGHDASVGHSSRSRSRQGRWFEWWTRRLGIFGVVIGYPSGRPSVCAARWPGPRRRLRPTVVPSSFGGRR